MPSYTFTIDNASICDFKEKYATVNSLEKAAFETKVMQLIPLLRKYDPTTVNIELTRSNWDGFFRNVVPVDGGPFTNEVVEDIKSFSAALAKTPPLDLFDGRLVDSIKGTIVHNCYTAVWVAATEIHGHAWELESVEVKAANKDDLEKCLGMLLPSAYDSQKMKASLIIPHLVLERDLQDIKWDGLFGDGFDVDAFDIRNVKVPAKKDGKIEGLPHYPKPDTEADDNNVLRRVWQDYEYEKKQGKKKPGRATKTARVLTYEKFRLQFPKLPGWSTFQTLIQRGREILVVLRLRFPDMSPEELDSKYDELFTDCQFLPETNTVIHGLLKELKVVAAAHDKKLRAERIAEKKAKKAGDKQNNLEDAENLLDEAQAKLATLPDNTRATRIQKNLVKSLEKTVKKAKDIADKATKTSTEAAQVAAVSLETIIQEETEAPSAKKKRKSELEQENQEESLTDGQKLILYQPPKRDRRHRSSVKYIAPGDLWVQEASTKLWTLTMLMNAVEEESEKHPDSMKLNQAVFDRARSKHLLTVQKEVFDENIAAAGPENLNFAAFQESITMIPDFFLSPTAKDTIIKLGFLGPVPQAGISTAEVQESLYTWLPNTSWRDFFHKAECLGYAAQLNLNQAYQLRKVTKRFAKVDRENMNTILSMLLKDECTA